MAQAARIVVHDQAQVRQAVTDLQQLVDLLLVFDHGHADAGIGQYEHHLVGHGILIKRHRHTAKALGRQQAPVQSRPVVTDHGQPLTAPEAVRRQPAGQRLHLVGHLFPVPALPDAQILFAHGRLLAAYVGVLPQQFGKRVGGSGRRGAAMPFRQIKRIGHALSPRDG